MSAPPGRAAALPERSDATRSSRDFFAAVIASYQRAGFPSESVDSLNLATARERLSVALATVLQDREGSVGELERLASGDDATEDALDRLAVALALRARSLAIEALADLGAA